MRVVSLSVAKDNGHFPKLILILVSLVATVLCYLLQLERVCWQQLSVSTSLSGTSLSVERVRWQRLSGSSSLSMLEFVRWQQLLVTALRCHSVGDGSAAAAAILCQCLSMQGGSRSGSTSLLVLDVQGGSSSSAAALCQCLSVQGGSSSLSVLDVPGGSSSL